VRITQKVVRCAFYVSFFGCQAKALGKLYRSS